jgi:hydrogenase small subunit
MAASGYQAEAALAGALRANRGNYVLVVEGAVPTGEGAGFARIAGRNALDAVREAAEGAAFVVAMGSCAAWGGVASAAPNPSHASGLSEVITGKPIVNLPGCPPNPTTLLAVLLEHAAMHRLPALDKAGRPRFAYDRLIHEDCPRRGHFDAGRFATAFGDEGHRAGWCLYKLGCKGTMTHASCSLRHFNGAANAWPIGIGAPCVGCTEQQVGFRIPLFQLADLHAATPPEALPPVAQPVHASQTAAELAVGALLGAGGTAAWFLSRKLPAGHAQTEENESENLEDPSDADVEKSEAPADEREKRP